MSLYTGTAVMFNCLSFITGTATNATQMTGVYISLHTGAPGTTGANELAGGAYARVQGTWGAVGVTNPDSVTAGQVSINVPANSTVSYWGVWTGATSGTWCDGGALPAPQPYTGSGVYLLTPTLNAS